MFQTEVREGCAGPLQVIRTPVAGAAELHGQMEHLARLAYGGGDGGDLADVIDAVRTLIPEYRPRAMPSSRRWTPERAWPDEAHDRGSELPRARTTATCTGRFANWPRSRPSI